MYQFLLGLICRHFFHRKGKGSFIIIWGMERVKFIIFSGREKLAFLQFGKGLNYHH